VSDYSLYVANNEKARPIDVKYTPEQAMGIAQVVKTIKANNPGMTTLEAEIREVLIRIRGDMGLSRAKVDYLTSCLMEVMNAHS
jgi:hypothetical protein